MENLRSQEIGRWRERDLESRTEKQRANGQHDPKPLAHGGMDENSREANMTTATASEPISVKAPAWGLSHAPPHRS